MTGTPSKTQHISQNTRNPECLPENWEKWVQALDENICKFSQGKESSETAHDENWKTMIPLKDFKTY